MWQEWRYRPPYDRGVGAGHGHGHVASSYRGRLATVLAVTLLVAAVQLVGGLASGSLALLADAGHLLTDGVGISAALGAGWLAARPATDARTYGLQRAEILAALGNALLLGGLGVWVLLSALGRWSDPPDVATGAMLVLAVVGIGANAGCLLLLREGQSRSLSLRGAYLEVLGDLLGSLAVLVAAAVIATTGYLRADVLASGAIGVLMVPRAWRLLREVLDVLLEATPRGVDLEQVRAHVREVPGVVDVHDLHAWTITSGVPVLSAHVVVDDACIASGRSGEVLDRLGDCLSGHFDVAHCTFQLEPVGHRAHEAAHHP